MRLSQEVVCAEARRKPRIAFFAGAKGSPGCGRPLRLRCILPGLRVFHSTLCNKAPGHIAPDGHAVFRFHPDDEIDVAVMGLRTKAGSQEGQPQEGEGEGRPVSPATPPRAPPTETGGPACAGPPISLFLVSEEATPGPTCAGPPVSLFLVSEEATPGPACAGPPICFLVELTKLPAVPLAYITTILLVSTLKPALSR